MARFRRSKKTGEVERKPDGAVRRSQVVGPYGPGAMIDLLQHAVIVGGLESWRLGDSEPIAEPRLRDRLQARYKHLSNLSESAPFFAPPECDDQEATQARGIRVLEFPAWFVCTGPKCGRLIHRKDLGDATKKDGRRFHECVDRRKRPAVPIRFVGACDRGHLQEFPWVRFAHLEKGKCGAPELTLREGAAGDFQSIRVSCACGQGQYLATATSKHFDLKCYGGRPWLPREHDKEECDETLKLLVRTSSSSYFPLTVSALSVPDPKNVIRDQLSTKAGDLRPFVEQGSEALQLYLKTLFKDLVAEHGIEVVEQQVMEIVTGEAAERLPIRTAEYTQFQTAPAEQTNEDFSEDARFEARTIETSAGLAKYVDKVVIAHRLREVRAQIGFTRLTPASSDNQGEISENAVVAPLSATKTWLPATTVQGEGLYFSLNKDALQAWENRPAVQERAKMLHEAFLKWHQSRGMSHGDRKAAILPFPRARFYLLHSLSHLLINAISLECGYSASSIRERIYCGPTDKDETDMAGVLLYTGTPGSEGTLGGLIEQGRRLEKHLLHARDLGALCSNDPLCGSHDPMKDRAERLLEGAACHGCLFIAEPSCEKFNQYLDRALVVPVVGQPPECAFFEGL